MASVSDGNEGGKNAPALAENKDHVEESKDLFIQPFKGKPRAEARIGVFAGEIQECETALWSLFEKRLLDNAVGDALDKIGSIVGQIRGNLSDADYLRYIKARIKANRSTSIADTIYEILDLTQGSSVASIIEERDLAEFEIRLLAATLQGDPYQIYDIMRNGRAAGVDFDFIAITHSPVAETFTFGDSGSPTTSTTQGFDDAAVPGTSVGKLAFATGE